MKGSSLEKSLQPRES